jgi:hypothetical protein
VNIDLIYCAGGNPRLSQIAYEEGWQLGYRSDKSMGDFPVVFVDIDYKRPNFEKHLEIVKRHRPRYATVPDLSECEASQADIDRALRQAEQIAGYCEIPLIVPKLAEQVAMLSPDVAVGYSIPSSYGGAKFAPDVLAGRRVHLLGGSPRKQWQAYEALKGIATVISADGNYAQGQAVKYAMYWQSHRWFYHPRKGDGGKDLYFECWRWSCRNIRAAWSALYTQSNRQ